MTDLWFLAAETNADIPVSVVMSVLVTDAFDACKNIYISDMIFMKDLLTDNWCSQTAIPLLTFYLLGI